MKRFLSVLAVAGLFSSLVACGNRSTTVPFDPPTDSKVLLETPGVFDSSLEEIDISTACSLYNIDETTVEDGAVHLGSTGVSLEELAIFTFTDETAAETAFTCLQYRIEDQKEASADYAAFLKDEMEKLDGAIVEQRSNSVLLVIAADYAPVHTFLGGNS